MILHKFVPIIKCLIKSNSLELFEILNWEKRKKFKWKFIEFHPVSFQLIWWDFFSDRFRFFYVKGKAIIWKGNQSMCLSILHNFPNRKFPINIIFYCHRIEIYRKKETSSQKIYWPTWLNFFFSAIQYLIIKIYSEKNFLFQSQHKL